MEPTRNLLIVHTPGYEALADWDAVRDRICERAPDIDVRIVNNLAPTDDDRAWQKSRPLLVFSHEQPRKFKPATGAIYVGRALSKLAENQSLGHAGIPVPRTLALIPGLTLKPDVWGKYVIVKPNRSGRGIGIQLALTEEVGSRFSKLWNNNPYRGQMLVQQFIDHTDQMNRPTDYRLLTVFGKSLCLLRRRWDRPRRALDDIARELSDEIASNAFSTGRHHREVVNDHDVLVLGELAARVFPHVPVLGIDIIRERGTGQLYVLELNGGGGVWDFSSDTATRFIDPQVRAAAYAQFDALSTVADLLIDKTRAEAR